MVPAIPESTRAKYARLGTNDDLALEYLCGDAARHEGAHIETHAISCDGARVRLDSGMQCVPEISANKYVLNIRFLAQNGDDPRPKTADWDVGFELTFCNL